MPEDHRLISSRGAFQTALRDAFSEVARVGCRDIVLCDPDFGDWPLGETEVIDALDRWVQPHRRLTLLAHDFGVLARRHARWVAWRRLWSHVVLCRSNPELEAAEVPTLLVAPGVSIVRLNDAVHWRGSMSCRPVDMASARREIDAVLQRSVEAFPLTTLGI